MSDLSSYVEVWRRCAADLDRLFTELDADDWSHPTDCPGWTVHDIVAHLAANESFFAGEPIRPGELPAEKAEGLNAFQYFNELGAYTRKDDAPEQLIEEFRKFVAVRSDQLKDADSLDPSGLPPYAPPGWTWLRLLRNRPLDLWMHEQDIRRAVGKPGDMNTVGARHTTSYFGSGLPYVLGKKVQPGQGTTVVWNVTEPVPLLLAATVNDEERGVELDEPPADPDLTLTMDTEAFMILVGGRRAPDAVDVDVKGDQALAKDVLTAMNVTP